MLLKMLVADTDEDENKSASELDTVDLYVLPEDIRGFYIPYDNELDTPVVNILHTTLKIFTAYLTDELKEFLLTKFVKE